jgi:NADPH:quinone reductase
MKKKSNNRFDERIRQLPQRLKEMKIKYAENIVDGLENTLQALIGLIEEENPDKQIVKVG